jgi:pyroglutamyl-peptidase
MTVRLLVTGFTPFPGAPVNPTEHLIRHFEDNPPLCNQDVEMRFAVLPVDYDQAIPALDAVSGDFDPHVAVHFGLADEARGFRLERLARNAIAARQPDNAGSRPPNAAIDPAGRDMPSTLPLELIAQALEEHGLPVEWSDDAGGYLCNYVFYHSTAGLCRSVRARVSGFVHVGPVTIGGATDEPCVLDFRKFAEGAEMILEICTGHARSETAPR